MMHGPINLSTAVYLNTHKSKTPKISRVQISTADVSKSLNYCCKYSYNKSPTKCTIPQIDFDKELYMFRTVDLSEICRVLYQINMRNSATLGFYYNNIYHDARFSECQILF